MKLSFRNKKKTIYIVIIIAVCFLVYSLIWYLIVGNKYDVYTNGMEWDTTRGARLAGKHFSAAGDNCDYTVKYPYYLEYVGNLAVVERGTQDALIIWPGIIGEDEYGLMLEYENEIYQIMVDKNMAAINSQDDTIVANTEDTIRLLVDAANDKWPGIFE
jgi:hypothetical protein